jgi:hypothetical protein
MFYVFIKYAKLWEMTEVKGEQQDRGGGRTE